MMKYNIFNYLDELYPNPKCELNYHNDYQLLLAIMLSAQTTDKRVNIVTEQLFNKYQTLETLKEANLEDLIAIVRQLGSYHKKARALKNIAQILADKYHGIVPKNRKELEQLPMVGRKTINVFLSVYYNVPNIAVDTHVERVSKRLGLAKENDNVLQVEKKLKIKVPRDCWSKFHHQLVFFGRYKCKSRNPICNDCKINNLCKYKKNHKL